MDRGGDSIVGDGDAGDCEVTGPTDAGLELVADIALGAELELIDRGPGVGFAAIEPGIADGEAGHRVHHAASGKVGDLLASRDHIARDHRAHERPGADAATSKKAMTQGEVS